MRLPRTLIAGIVAALACPLAALAAAPQELTVTASDGTPLACGLVLPDEAPPAGGWPAVILFHGLGQTHATLEAAATAALAPSGFASLACDARGTGGSGGLFGLDGPQETQDTRDLFAWLAARPDVSDTRIGALGLSLGGGEVWNAAVAGVPFRAIVPAISWTSLGAALAPGGVPKTGLLAALAQAVPAERWDPGLAALRDALLGGAVTPETGVAAAARSARAGLGALTVPTLIVQGRRDYLFDLDQALTAYRALRGPKRLYVGDLGHAPAANPPTELLQVVGEAVDWFRRWLDGVPPGKALPGVELAHDPWDGSTAGFSRLPATRTATVTLPGRTVLAPGVRVSRSARLTGGPHETFGAGALTVRYSGAQGWTRLVAAVSVEGSQAPLTLGAVRIGKAAGTATIHLLDEVVRVPRGRRLVVTIGASAANGLFAGEPAAGATVTLGRVTLRLPFLRARG